MKSKVIYTVAISLMFAGIACFIIGLFLVDFDFHKLAGNYDVTAHTDEFACPTDTISIYDDNVAVTIRPSGDELVHVYSMTNQYESYSMEADSSTLNVKKADTVEVHIGFFFSIMDRRLVVEIPAKYDGTLQIETQNGSISLEGMYDLKDATLTTKNGRIDLDGITVDGSLNCETKNGAINLNDINAKKIEAQTSNGKISAEDVDAADTLRFKTSNAKIDVSNLKAGDAITLKTSNGKICGSIWGSEKDYTISTKTSNGSNTLTDRDGGSIKLNVETSNGKIDLRFTGESN